MRCVLFLMCLLFLNVKAGSIVQPLPESSSSSLSISSELVQFYEPYQIRAQSCINAAARRLFETMARKQTNLAFAADVTTKKELLQLADLVGPYICLLKTHIDIIQDFDLDLLSQLTALAKKHRFLIFEDRKFADIGNTVKLQYEGGIYTIAQWADLVTVHTLSGPGIIDGLAPAVQRFGNGIILLPSMSSAGNLLTPEYAQATLALANTYKAITAGLIIRDYCTFDPSFIVMMPGVQIQNNGDGLGQQYVSPESAIELGADVIIVGRGIYQAPDPVHAAQIYRDRARSAHCKKIICARRAVPE